MAGAYLDELIPKFASDPRVLAWDLLNEGDLIVQRFGSNLDDMLDFYRAVSTRVRLLDSNHPITAGFGDIDQAHLSADFVDFISFHDYQDPALLGEAIRTLRGRAGGVPIVAEEAGFPSAGNASASLSGHLTRLGGQLDTILVREELAGVLVWSLTDFNPPATLLTRFPDPMSDPIQLKYGVFDGDLQPKLSAQRVRRSFLDDVPGLFRVDLVYSQGSTSPVPGDGRYLSVGIIYLEFLDGTLTTLDRLTLGTLDANLLQGHGWYPNEAFGQWTGSLDLTSSLDLPIPEETAILRFRAVGFLSGTDLEVHIDGVSRGKVRLDTVEQEFEIALE